MSGRIFPKELAVFSVAYARILVLFVILCTADSVLDINEGSNVTSEWRRKIYRTKALPHDLRSASKEGIIEY